MTMDPATASNPVVVFVDDDDLALQSLTALCRLETEYRVESFTEIDEALKFLASNPVDVVVSDFLMPKMNGVEFLSKVRMKQPDAARILLTGYADKDNAIRGINEAGLYLYLEKPWDNDQLLISLRNAVREKGLRRQLAGKIKEFTTLMEKHEALSEEHRRLEKELALAAQVQQNLLPQKFPVFEPFCIEGRYLPSALLGGDYYDAAVREGELVLLASDASGHGVQAALTSMFVKAVFQEEALAAADPLDLARRMNGRLHPFMPGGMFVAASIVWIKQSEPEQVFLVNAGYPYPLLIPGRGAETRGILADGLPMGLFPDDGPAKYEVEAITLKSGEYLLLASDGLADVQGPTLETFGDHRLQDSLSKFDGESGGELLDYVLEQMRAFSSSARLTDDISLVVIARS